jgi:hypothetical protein
MIVTRFALGKNQCQNNKQSLSSFSRFDLINVKARAVRRGVWFRVLSRIERACVDLVVKVVGRVRSSRLQEMLVSILSKLEDAMRNPMQHLMRTEAKSLASKLSQIAQRWGNESAVGWVKNTGFIRFLAISCLNAVS